MDANFSHFQSSGFEDMICLFSMGFIARFNNLHATFNLMDEDKIFLQEISVDSDFISNLSAYCR